MSLRILSQKHSLRELVIIVVAASSILSFNRKIHSIKSKSPSVYKDPSRGFSLFPSAHAEEKEKLSDGFIKTLDQWSDQEYISKLVPYSMDYFLASSNDLYAYFDCIKNTLDTEMTLKFWNKEHLITHRITKSHGIEINSALNHVSAFKKEEFSSLLSDLYDRLTFWPKNMHDFVSLEDQDVDVPNQSLGIKDLKRIFAMLMIKLMATQLSNQNVMDAIPDVALANILSEFNKQHLYFKRFKLLFLVGEIKSVLNEEHAEWMLRIAQTMILITFIKNNHKPWMLADFESKSPNRLFNMVSLDALCEIIKRIPFEWSIKRRPCLKEFLSNVSRVLLKKIYKESIEVVAGTKKGELLIAIKVIELVELINNALSG